MDVFNYKSYKDYVRSWVRSFPSNGRGQYKKMAHFLGVHTTMISHIFKGDQNLSVEHGVNLCEYLGLNEEESNYFIELLHYERAGSAKAKSFILKRLKHMSKKSEKIANKVSPRKQLSEKDKAQYYSDWYYSAIRLSLFNPEFNSIEALSQRFNISPSMIIKAINFLKKSHLIEVKEGNYTPLMNSTHLGENDPLVNRHHKNWREKSMANLIFPKDHDLHFTNPVMISKKDKKQIKKLLLNFVKESDKITSESGSETLCCLNFDWFEV